MMISPAQAKSLPLETIRLPAGFHISLYADNVPDARSLALSPSGIVYVGTRKAGKVYALLPNSSKTRAAKVLTIAEDLSMPNGIDYYGGDLYIAETHRVIRLDDIDQRVNQPPKPRIIKTGLPTAKWHGWRYCRFGPDGYLYLSIGAPCNVCLRHDPHYASIVRMKADGSEMTIYAHGVRNSVGMDWHPTDNALWFTDNGRDWLGDDFPPDTLNRAAKAGMHFGFPYVNGDNVPDPDYGHLTPGQRFTPPAKTLGPHVAALGMQFYRGKQFPSQYHQQLFIAEHGSWNRSSKIGYRLSLVTLLGNRVLGYRPFASGWLQGDDAWGRPVDVLMLADGSLLLSDDYAGVVYRIHYQPSTQNPVKGPVKTPAKHLQPTT